MTPATTPASKPRARALHHLTPPVTLADRTSAERLRTLRDMAIAHGDWLDYRVTAGKLHPAVAQSERHTAKRVIVDLLRASGADAAQIAAVLPGWEAWL